MRNVLRSRIPYGKLHFSAPAEGHTKTKSCPSGGGMHTLLLHHIPPVGSRSVPACCTCDGSGPASVEAYSFRSKAGARGCFSHQLYLLHPAAARAAMLPSYLTMPKNTAS